MGVTLAIDVGIQSGLALLNGAHIATDTVRANDLADYLDAVCVTLAYPNVALDAVVAERPLCIWRSRLSRDLDALCHTVEIVFPRVRWIEPSEWKQTQELLTRYARSRHLVAWRHARSRHEKDALLISLWAQGVLAPVKSS